MKSLSASHPLSNSSSESDMEEEQEEQEEQEEGEQHPLSPSDLGGVPWKEAVELHAKLRGEEGDDVGEALDDAVSRDGEIDEDDDEEEEEEDDEDEDEEESSDGKFVRC